MNSEILMIKSEFERDFKIFSHYNLFIICIQLDILLKQFQTFIYMYS